MITEELDDLMEEVKIEFNDASVTKKFEFFKEASDYIFKRLVMKRNYKTRLWSVEEVRFILILCEILDLKSTDPLYTSPELPHPIILFEKALTIRSFKGIAKKINADSSDISRSMWMYSQYVFSEINIVNYRLSDILIDSETIGDVTWNYYRPVTIS